MGEGEKWRRLDHVHCEIGWITSREPSRYFIYTITPPTGHQDGDARMRSEHRKQARQMRRQRGGSGSNVDA
eukprot:scaffold98149_cov24-Cyclotella_meneghiniana.AAC.2